MYFPTLFNIVMVFCLTSATCNQPDKYVTQRNYLLSPIASFTQDTDELKKRWFYCEHCLKSNSCSSQVSNQCKTVTLPDRAEALNNAITQANADAVHFLVDVAKTDVNSMTGRYKETPLMVAAYYGSQCHQDIADYLIARGAEINATNGLSGNYSALLIAIWKNNISFAAHLLSRGANPSLAYEGEACNAAIARQRLNFIPLIPGCCSIVKIKQQPAEALYLCP